MPWLVLKKTAAVAAAATSVGRLPFLFFVLLSEVVAALSLLPPHRPLPLQGLQLHRGRCCVSRLPPRQPRPRPRSFLCWCFNLSAWWAGRVGLFPGGWGEVGRTSVPRRWWWWTKGAGGTGQPRGTRWRVQTTLAGLSAHARAAGRGAGRAPPKALSPLSHPHSLLLPLPPRGLALPASCTHAPTPPATAHCAALPAVTAVPAGGAQPIPPHIPLPPPLRPPCHRPATAAMADATTRGRGLYS